jgi:pimeloyl-ACP methyl ester carboxylesterase
MVITSLSRTASSARHWRALAIALGVLVLASACATPIGVSRGDTQAIYRDLTASVLSTGQPSSPTRRLLLRRGLSERFEKDPEELLAELRGSGANLTDDDNYALAELSFAYAEKSHKREYYLAAAVYAYAFLVPPDRGPELNVVDPRIRLSADLYNLGLVFGLSTLGGNEVLLTPGERPLPWGTLELETDPAEFLWSGFRMTRFVPVTEFEVRGLRNRYRQAGVGAPLAAELTPTGDGPDAQAARKRIPPRIKVAVTAFVRIENVDEGIASGNVKGRLELYTADQAVMVDLGGRRVSLELDPTATLAYMLEGAPIWDTEIGNFLSPTREVFGDGLAMLHPYRPGQIPVVLVHGTASSPARWAEMLNELQNDPVLRDRVQFWLFTYNTSNPILLSARNLRDALTSAVHDLDPEGRDPALHDMVLIGHSQGGLLVRLMVTDSQNRFWSNVSKEPLSELKMSPDIRELLQTSMFFEPLPFVKRVVFICTPHRGSFRATGFVLDIVRRLVTLPIKIVKGAADVVTQNEAYISPEARQGIRKMPTAVDNMSPNSPFAKTLSASPIASDVTVNSIVAVQGDGPLTSLSDGVVRYDSAHLDGIGTEKIVRSSHSTQAEPDTIEEVRRILREQVAEEDSRANKGAGATTK